MDSESASSSDSDYNKFSNEKLYVGDIQQMLLFEPIFTAAEMQAKNT